MMTFPQLEKRLRTDQIAGPVLNIKDWVQHYNQGLLDISGSETIMCEINAHTATMGGWVHKSANVHRYAYISEDAIIMDYAQISAYSKIHDTCIIYSNAIVEKYADISESSIIANNVIIATCSTISNCIFGDSQTMKYYGHWRNNMPIDKESYVKNIEYTEHVEDFLESFLHKKTF